VDPHQQNEKGPNGQPPAQTVTAPPPHESDKAEVPTDLPQIKPFWMILLGGIIAAVIVIAFVVRFVIQTHQQNALAAQQDAAAEAPVLVDVVRPQPTGQYEELRLPGDIRPWQITALYARISGYLKQWTHEVGTHVDAGQLLAKIDAPDVDAQLDQARATLEQANANLVSANQNNDLMQSTYVRYQGLIATGGVTQQDLQTRQTAAQQAEAALGAAKATVKSAAANVTQLEAEQGFEQIVAPFSGTVTTRNYDIGALISPSNTTASSELFTVAETDKFRVYADVPQDYVTMLHIGDQVILQVRNYPGRNFIGHLVYWSGALRPATRTLPVEVDVENHDGLLWAGMYADLVFKIKRNQPTLVVPSSAIMTEAEGTQIAVVQDNKINFRTVTLGRDFGAQIEVATGLTPDDQIVANPGEKLAEGITVQIAQPSGSATGSPMTAAATTEPSPDTSATTRSVADGK
jgi:membrane fusion protein (multidrug efflux system)